MTVIIHAVSINNNILNSDLIVLCMPICCVSHIQSHGYLITALFNKSYYKFLSFSDDFQDEIAPAPAKKVKTKTNAKAKTKQGETKSKTKEPGSLKRKER